LRGPLKDVQDLLFLAQIVSWNMPVQSYVDQREPEKRDAVIWRFMDLDKFRDLMASEELYLRREDKLKKDDPQEGLPPDDYFRSIRRLQQYVLNDELTLNNTKPLTDNSARCITSTAGTCLRVRNLKFAIVHRAVMAYSWATKSATTGPCFPQLYL
jgi:hypothetical protein